MTIRKVIVRIDSTKAFNERFSSELQRRLGQPFDTDELELAFESVEQMRSLLTRERDRLLKVLQTERPRSIYALAKLLRRSQSAVQEDVTLLATYGLVRLAPGVENGRRVLQPIPNFEEIHFVRNYRAEAEAERASQDSPKTLRTRRPRGALRGPPPKLSVKPPRVAAAKT